jgi:hypothetical protein
MPELQELQLDGKLDSQGDWAAAAKQLPNLTTLRLIWLWGHNPGEDVPSQILAPLQALPGLRSLAAMYSSSYPALAALSQLQNLSLPVPTSPEPTQDASTLSRLTGLTALTFQSVYSKAPAPLWQSQLGSALAALTQLQRLSLPQVCFWICQALPERYSCCQPSKGAAGPSSPHPGWRLIGVKPQSLTHCRRCGLVQ